MGPEVLEHHYLAKASTNCQSLDPMIEQKRYKMEDSLDRVETMTMMNSKRLREHTHLIQIGLANFPSSRNQFGQCGLAKKEGEKEEEAQRWVSETMEIPS